MGTAVTDGKRDIVLFLPTAKPRASAEDQVRSMGRVSRGVRGIRLSDDHR